MPKEDISRLRGLDTLPLLRELQIPLWKVPVLAWRARQMFATRVNQVELIPGMAGVVRELARQHELYVLSSNSADNVQSVLKRSGLASYFKRIYGRARPLHKEHALRKLLRQNKIAPQEAWYVGDEVRDIVAARHVGMRIMAVSWGYNNIGALEHQAPDALVFTPDELLARITQGQRHE